MAHAHDDAITDPAEYWDARYIADRDDTGQMWSGRVNAAVEYEVAQLAPGTALELGSGEGGDALWLAARGWTVVAVDISKNALAVAAGRAAAQGLTTRITWVQADLATWHPSAQYDLVTTAFLHSPVELPRDEILRRAVAAVARGGRMLVVGHLALPATGSNDHDHDHEALPTSDAVLASLQLPEGWTVETNAVRHREVRLQDGSVKTIADTVVRVRRDE